MKKPLMILAVLIGILLIIAAGVYAINPADALPHFLPGYQAGLTKHHLTHAAASLVLGIFAFIFAWFQTKKPSSPQEQQGQ